MTLFEYLALLAGLPYAAQPGRRYWVHLVHVCGVLVLAVNVFWIFWSYKDASWTLPKFWLVLANPGLMYFNACTLIPEHASAINEWRGYYYSVRQRYFIGVTVWVFLVSCAATFILEMPACS